jgi:RNA polymerase sigma-70 factor (ECF subfamily)
MAPSSTLLNATNATATVTLITRTASDDALLAAIAAGNRAALGILYARHADTLRKTAAAALPKTDDTSADDIVQDVFLALADGRASTFQPAKGKALAWLKGIARREVTLHTSPFAASPPKTPREAPLARKRGAE